MVIKFKGYGIKGELLKWIENFLCQRKQRVVIGVAPSSWSDVTGGIPQGSVLGPTLFLIYINDLPDVVKSMVKLFADDTKLYSVVNNQQEAEELQTDLDSNTRNKVLTAKLLRQGYRYHKLRKAFSKFYWRHFDIVSKYNVGLKTLLLQGLSEPEFYGDLVYKFRKIIGKNDFPYHFKKIIVRYKKIGYNINVMRQTACLVVNPIKVNSLLTSLIARR